MRQSLFAFLLVKLRMNQTMPAIGIGLTGTRTPSSIAFSSCSAFLTDFIHIVCNVMGFFGVVSHSKRLLHLISEIYR